MVKAKLKEKLNIEKITNPEETSLENLEKTLDLLSGKVKKMVEKNGFSKKLKKRVDLELNQ